jgi:hypothetical protein
VNGLLHACAIFQPACQPARQPTRSDQAKKKKVSVLIANPPHQRATSCQTEYWPTRAGSIETPISCFYLQKGIFATHFTLLNSPEYPTQYVLFNSTILI